MKQASKYYAIDGTYLSMKDEWLPDLLQGKTTINLQGITGKKGLLFSNISLEKFIEEEYRHDRFDLTQGANRSIRTFSSGEQKKALLNFQLKQHPDFLVIDNPFDALDAKSVEQLKSTINSITARIPVIQIFKRINDLLDFITDVIIIEGNQIIRQTSLADYLKEREAVIPAIRRIPSFGISYTDIPDKLIEFKQVSVNYGENKILDNICWTIKRGEFWQLSGPNGSGKTTLLSMIYGDNPKAYGADLFLFGKKKGSGESVWDLKKKIGYFTPSMTTLFHRGNTLEQMIISGLVDSIGLYKKATGRQKEIAKEWLDAIGLTEKRNTSFQKLSQVHQRMVLIARSMVKHPPLLILDEPSTGLDDSSAFLLVQLINKIAKESQTAIIYVSHRTEAGLSPHFRYQLQPTEHGSTGRVV